MDASSLSSLVSATNLAAQNTSTNKSATGASASGSSSAGGTDAFSNITSNDFLQMMIAQLQNQDPMNPMDDSQLLQQISQIRDIQASTELSSTLGGLSVGQNLASASALINKNVTALDADGNNISGVVQSVSMTNGQPQLVINGSNVSLSNIKTIQPDTTPMQIQDADADTLLQNIQNLLTNGILTQDKNADQSLSNLQQILLSAAGSGGTTSTGSSSSGSTGDGTGTTAGDGATGS